MIRHVALYHIEDDGLVNHCTRNGERVGHTWARAQSHALYGMLHVLEEMEGGDPERQSIIDLMRRVGRGLKIHQDAETGLWRNLVDHPAARLEVTGTAGFTYVYGRGVREGWLAADEFGDMVRRGREGLKLCYWRNGFAASCRGTYWGLDPVHYLARPQGWSKLPQALMALAMTRHSVMKSSSHTVKQ